MRLRPPSMLLASFSRDCSPTESPPFRIPHLLVTRYTYGENVETAFSEPWARSRRSAGPQCSASKLVASKPINTADQNIPHYLRLDASATDHHWVLSNSENPQVTPVTDNLHPQLLVAIIGVRFQGVAHALVLASCSFVLLLSR